MIFSESGSRSVMSPSWTSTVLPPAQWPRASMTPGGAGDRHPRLVIAVEIANGDETLRLWRRG